jgi:enoyl-CoA hydratase/carnithine racemase
LAAHIEAAPRASLALIWLLRSSESLPIEQALVSESATYSMLLAGGEFRSWLAARPPRREPDDSQRVRITRTADLLRVTLARPQRRNAVDAAMRDALVAALAVALADPALTVEIDAAGPAFCAGGDLDEFGTATDPAAAHLIRVAASVGRQLAQLSDRVSVRLHGACVGAGIELPAFAGRVTATRDAWFALPEVGMGLVPGAGGTVSLPRRIGRQRTAWLALSRQRIEAPTAIEWGLVDALE